MTDRAELEDLLQELVGGDTPEDNRILVWDQDRGWFFDVRSSLVPADWTTISASDPSGTPTLGLGSLWVKTA